MKQFQIRLLIILLGLLAPTTSWCVATEVSMSYAYKKSTFDVSNNTEQQSTTASASVFFFERVAFELSYTNGLFVKKEKQANAPAPQNFLRTTTVYSDIYGADLIFVLAGRDSTLQPFIKGGLAQINRKQVVQDDNNNPWEIKYAGVSPSYGVGLRVKAGDNLSLKMSYDILQTPVDDQTKIDEITGRVGFAWTF